MRRSTGRSAYHQYCGKFVNEIVSKFSLSAWWRPFTELHFASSATNSEQSNTSIYQADVHKFTSHDLDIYLQSVNLGISCDEGVINSIYALEISMLK